MFGVLLCRNYIVPHGKGCVNYTGSSTLRQALEPFVMPVCGLFAGAILPASYYYSIKKRRGARCAAPQ